MRKEQISDILFLEGEILFKELSPSIMLLGTLTGQQRLYGTGLVTQKKRYYYLLSVLSKVGCIAGFVLNC
jgi:hypothetical protein